MNVNMQSISPRVFVMRASILYALMGIIQLLHITFVAEFDIRSLLVLEGTVTLGMILLLLSYLRMSQSMEWPAFNQRVFKWLFLSTFVITFVCSRLPYIFVFLEKGLYLTRLDTSVGGGGWYSAFSILFYPLCILLAFIDIPRRKYYGYAVLMFAVISVDFIILGTRNAPFFVLLFHLLMLRVRFFRVRSICCLVALAIFMVVLVDYQTRGRSADVLTVGWDWVATIRYSWIFDNMPIPSDVVSSTNEVFPVLMPLIYLVQYVTHSMAEFGVVLEHGAIGIFGSGLYFEDQVCLLLACDRQAIQDAILQINPRAGTYQTLYASLLLDFGFIGTLILILLLVIYLLSGRKNGHVSGFVVYIVMVVLVSGIDNYIYNGLGVWRFGVFVALWYALSRRGGGLTTWPVRSGNELSGH
ncbi:Uncharacterised protein [Achromobacter sp. 2789STDY5608633]|uniref:Uncharacterized protein n=2 Tax=Alcaligenaceae TaxID=506 RepID=A0A6J4ZN56_9BURK|nr:hypothetical protein LMG26845_01838 [Achromobacter insuavis]CUJ05612.1 Uncharacterised protein [Achromobacter sp. 2789STDY5608633]CUJ17219.1 Uncharacterised protein [Achromobacter sp. 2789STDY5608621]CUJ61715.1 Uncharacterised protein [Achromobacter sp. 2789STDY5608628]CUJ87928.1 Uncharacterised protein [Achromobacter sp. 2789STDY5608615]